MKQLIKLSLLLMALLLPAIATAHDFEVDGIYYNIYGNVVEVTKPESPYGEHFDYSGEIIIPETVTYNGVTYLVTSIGGAFRYCSSLTSIEIPNTVTQIGYCAFEDCSRLASITIPESITYVGQSAFRNCSALRGAFIIPDSVTYIGSYAFENCSGITSLTIGKKVSHMGRQAFWGCTSLDTLNFNSVFCEDFSSDEYERPFINQNFSTINIGNEVQRIPAYLAYRFGKLTSIDIPNSVTSIGDYAFYYCSGLTSITIGNSVTSIGDYAFYYCSGLISIDIPNSVTTIGSYAFNMCSRLTSITIGNSVISISDGAFSNCSGLTSIDIPNSVTTIGSRAFIGCSGLTSITVTNGNSIYDSRNNCNSIIETATNTLIAGCKNTTIPNSVTSIGDYAFNGCSGLTSVTIPTSVTSIGSYAFLGCSGLASVTIPNSVINFGERVFSSLLSLTIEGEGEWSGGVIDCQASCLTIDSRITSVKGMKVNASEIYCYSTTPPTCDETSFTEYSGTLHVPATSLSSYFIADYWSNFANIVGDAVELTDISISRDSVEVSIGTIFSMTATLTPANATPSNIIWRSTDTAIATVNNGKVTTMGIGECDIIAHCSNKRAICHMVVNDTVITITLDKQEAKVLPNHTLFLNPGAYPIMVDGFVVSSSNPNVAVARIMDGKVQVVGIKEGTAIITVGSTDGTAIPATCLVTVYTEVGDMNCDGYVNISDVTNLIDFLLTDNQEGISIDNADTNKDGHVNISDVTQLIDYLLTGLWPWDYETFTVNGVTFKMIVVEGGTFTMGYKGSDALWQEYPTHQVTVSTYSIGQTEVTQALWKAVMGSNPSFFTASNGYTDDLQLPVENVSWNDCQTFISRLNQLTGKNFRLPTEAEWEFAARGGNRSKGYKYAGSNNIDEVAWWGYNYGGNSGYGTNKVATKSPNELFLYDMSGNVWEWCKDYYSEYSSEAQTNPTGPTSGTRRVKRSGDWQSGAGNCRVSYRVYNYPTGKDKCTGLRLAL